MKIQIHKLHGNVAIRRQGFTLTEIMLVVVIIGILAALVIPKIAGSSERARVTAAHADINGGIKSAIGQYEVDNGFYPKSLQELIVQPSNAKNWHGPYFDPPKLPWIPGAILTFIITRANTTPVHMTCFRPARTVRKARMMTLGTGSGNFLKSGCFFYPHRHRYSHPRI